MLKSDFLLKKGWGRYNWESKKTSFHYDIPILEKTNEFIKIIFL